MTMRAAAVGILLVMLTLETMAALKCEQQQCSHCIGVFPTRLFLTARHSLLNLDRNNNAKSMASPYRIFQGAQKRSVLGRSEI